MGTVHDLDIYRERKEAQAYREQLRLRALGRMIEDRPELVPVVDSSKHPRRRWPKW